MSYVLKQIHHYISNTLIAIWVVDPGHFEIEMHTSLLTGTPSPVRIVEQQGVDALPIS